MFRSLPARCALAATLAVTATALPATAQAATDAAISTSVQSGADWVETQQDGATGSFNPGFSSFDPTPPALAAAGRHPADVANGGPSLQDAIFTALSDPSDPMHPGNAGAFQNGILSGVAAGIDPARISASENLTADLAGTYSGGYFGDPTLFNTAAYGALALNRVPAPGFLVARSRSVIRENQHNDGGWGFARATSPADQAQPGDVDVTGATLAALCESGVPASDPAVASGVDFLRANFDSATGGFLSFGSSNANTNAAAISGLNACGIDPQGAGFDAGQTPVDYLIARQGPSNGANDGSFEYADPPNPFVPDGPNLGASRDAVRALAGATFSADPPARANPTLPRRRPVPAVADGTIVPVALAVDDGSGGVTFCRVTVPSGASLAALLAAANGASTPAGCATGGRFTAGQLSNLNGRAGTWAFSVDGGPEQVAAGQAVRFGDFVALRRTSGAVPSAGGSSAGGQSGGGATPASVPAAEQAKSTPTGVASRSLKVSARKRVVSVSLRCAKANRLCQGSVYLVYRKRTLARRAFLIGGGKTTKLNVKLSKRSMKRLGRKRKRIKVNVFSRDGAGIASTSTRTVTLTPGK
ncbi:MAG TPA: prenyltransferase/squalene oxidase repeat-containing protein [Thermoleophilaceae bacterium]|nr:prenyltransferase/squalene oxidase repeat-containing protein [Thermoleophilaceae bacterium]